MRHVPAAIKRSAISRDLGGKEGETQLAGWKDDTGRQWLQRSRSWGNTSLLAVERPGGCMGNPTAIQEWDSKTCSRELPGGWQMVSWVALVVEVINNSCFSWRVYYFWQFLQISQYHLILWAWQLPSWDGWLIYFLNSNIICQTACVQPPSVWCTYSERMASCQLSFIN